MKSIFVSSTFKDMHEERDILHKRVIPELNEYAAQYGESVSLCDLRWGVNTEDLDSEEGSRKVLSVCLDEIDRCRPYMIVLLGERYGWIPESETLQEIEKTRVGMNLEDLEKSVTALEIEYGALANKEQLEHTLFYFREFEGPVPKKYGREDALHRRKLFELKDRIRKLSGTRVHTYTVSWDAQKNTLKGLENFTEQITADLKELLEEEWKGYAFLTPFARDQRLQWDFARQKSDQFRAREGLIDQYLNKLNQGQNLLAISGASGSGKSTLIGRLAVRLQEQGKDVLPIFCGSTMFCNDAMDVIRYIVRFIEDCFSLEHYEIKKSREVEELSFENETGYRENKTDADRWAERLADMCALYTEKSDRELVILIDALDQLFPDEIRDRLRFIPANLSSKVKMVCSFLDSFDTGYHKKWEQEEQLLSLDETDKKAVIDGILYSQGRELSFPVIKKIMTKKGSDTPLYLSLAVQRLVMMDQEDFEKITATGDGMDAIAAYQIAVIDGLPENLEELCMALVHVVSEKLENNMAELAVRYIAVSRYGLRETDLEGIFVDQGIEWKNLDFTLFLRYMKSFFLLRDDGRLDFTHQSIRMGVLKNDVTEKELHRQILECLKKLNKWDGVRISEIIYHCWGADAQRFFVQYVSTYEDDGGIIRSAAKGSYEIAMLDNGNWLCTVIKNGSRYSANHDFMRFLNFDLDESFGSSQKELNIHEKIFDKVIGLAEKLLEKESGNESWHDLNISCERLGDICEKQGIKEKLKKAQEIRERSLEISLELEKRERDRNSQRELSISFNKLGDIYMKQGDKKNLIKAGEMYQRSLEISLELEKKERNSDSQRDLSISFNKIGDIYMKQDRKESLEKAREMYERSLDLREKIADIKNTTESWRDVSVSCFKIGDTYEKQGENDSLRRAREMYGRSLKIDVKLAKIEESSERQRDLSVSYERIGDNYNTEGGRENCAKAREMYEKSLAIRERLYKREKTLQSLWDLAVIYEKIGDVYKHDYDRENLLTACKMYEKKMIIVEEIVKRDETLENLYNLSICYKSLGDIYMSQGNKKFLNALKMYDSSLRINKRLVKQKVTLQNLQELGDSYERIADCCKKNGGKMELVISNGFYKKGLAIRKRLFKEERTIQRLQDLSVCYEKTGDSYIARKEKEYLYIARKMYERKKVIAEELIKKEKTPQSLRDLCVSYEKIGDSYQEEGGKENFERARKMYEQGLDIRKQLAKEERTTWSLRDLSISYERIGDSYQEEGEKENFERARKMYEKSLTIQKSLLREEETLQCVRQLGACYKKIGDCYKKIGDCDKKENGVADLLFACKMYKQSLKMKEKIAEVERNQHNLQELITGYKNIRDIYKKVGKRKYFRQYREMYEKELAFKKELLIFIKKQIERMREPSPILEFERTLKEEENL